MPMKNRDFISQKTKELATNILAAVKSGDEAGITTAFADFQEAIAQQNANDIALAIQQMDSTVLSARGARQLTSEEREYFQKIIDASASTDPRQALTDVAKAMPTTIIDTVLEEIRSEHPLLDVIDFQNTTGITKLIYSEDGTIKATWKALNTKITEEISKTIKTLDVIACKLSAFLPVPKDMIDLGPAWLLTLTVELLKEAAADGLEEAVVIGTGKDEPIGMIKNLSGSVVDGVYPDKTAEVLNAITPTAYNAIVAKVAKKANGKARKVPEVIFVVNPTDYLNKVLPATTVRATDGSFKTEIFPYPTKVIQSEALTEGTAVLGIAKQYLLGLGSNKEGKIDYDDSCQFLEDNRVYKIKLYGNGRPKDNGSFVKLDISGLVPANAQVEIVNTTAKPVNTKAVV